MRSGQGVGDGAQAQHRGEPAVSLAQRSWLGLLTPRGKPEFVSMALPVPAASGEAGRATIGKSGLVEIDLASGRRLRIDGPILGLPPYKYVCKVWSKEPGRFTLEPAIKCRD